MIKKIRRLAPATPFKSFYPPAVFVIFFLIGYLTAPTYDGLEKAQQIEKTFHRKGDTAKDALLEHQLRAQETIQSRIRLLQDPIDCEQARKLIVRPSASTTGANGFEKFAREFHILSMALQVAVSTGRTLVLVNEWTLLPISGSISSSKCDERDLKMKISSDTAAHFRGIACLQPATLSNCASSGSSDSSFSSQQQNQHLDPSLSFGILSQHKVETETSLFDIQFYGPKTAIEMPMWPFPRATMLIDILPHWERQKGRFWARSQMVHYLWEQWQRNLPPREKTVEPYIAFYWSSSKSSRKSFAVKYGRNASETQSFERYMQMATVIRQKYEPRIKTIYLVTDGVHGGEGKEEVPPPKNLNKDWPGWEFLSPSVASSFRDDTNEESQILGSLEILRRADFLVGTFQSQMYRMGCELNAAWFANQYASTMKRHWALDVEWFENP